VKIDIDKRKSKGTVLIGEASEDIAYTTVLRRTNNPFDILIIYALFLAILNN
jgi:hypothetical protein